MIWLWGGGRGPTCRLSNLSAFQFVGLLGSWRAGRVAGGGGVLLLVVRGGRGVMNRNDTAAGAGLLGGGLPGGKKRKERQPARVGGAGASAGWGEV